jgi:hypothetical protein
MLKIYWCKILENIVSKDETENDVNLKTIKFSKLREVKLRELPMLKNFAFYSNSSKSLFNENISLPGLEILKVGGCSMTNLWSTQIHPSFFENLKSLEMRGCHTIQSLFSPSVVSCLVQLQMLDIYSCKILENIVSKDETENDVNLKTIKFSKLREVTLDHLPMLKNFAFYSNSSKSLFNENISLPGLEILEVKWCNSMEAVFDLNGVELSVKHGYEEPILGQLKEITIYESNGLTHIWRNFPNQGLIQSRSFAKLEKLYIYQCNQLRYIFSASVATLLVNLQYFNVKYCDKIEQVMDKTEEEETEKRMDKIVFPKLQELYLVRLKCLTSFYLGSRDLEFPTLKKVTFYGCPLMENFCTKSVSTPELEAITGYTRDWTELKEAITGDLNSTVQNIKQSYDDARAEEMKTLTTIEEV